MLSKMMIERDFRDRGHLATHVGGAPKKSSSGWRWSDTILSGSRPQVLLYGPLRGRGADQGEWSEGRTSEEGKAPRRKVRKTFRTVRKAF
jgi:hypothetical protein